MADIEAIPVSALNQYAYCPRRCGLIHQEGKFTDNIHTARGNAEHERVDRVAHETLRSGARVEYALPVWSDRLGLIGKSLRNRGCWWKKPRLLSEPCWPPENYRHP